MHIFLELSGYLEKVHLGNGTVSLKMHHVPKVWTKDPNVVYEYWVIRNKYINSTDFKLSTSQLQSHDVGYHDTMKYVHI